MKNYTFFYHPKDKNLDKKIYKLLDKKGIDCELLDVTSNGISSYLYKDMRIKTLPAFYVFSKNEHKIYQGRDKIEALLSRK